MIDGQDWELEDYGYFHPIWSLVPISPQPLSDLPDAGQNRVANDEDPTIRMMRT